MTPNDIPNGNPLSLFQVAEAKKREDVLGIVTAIAELRGGPDSRTLGKRFEPAWTAFEALLAEQDSKAEHPSTPPPPRPSQELLEEIHEDVRELVRAARARPAALIDEVSKSRGLGFTAHLAQNALEAFGLSVERIEVGGAKHNRVLALVTGPIPWLQGASEWLACEGLLSSLAGYPVTLSLGTRTDDDDRHSARR